MCSINFTTNCFWFGEWRDKDLYVKPFSRKRTLASHSHHIYLTLSFSYYFCLCLFGTRVSRHHCRSCLELCCLSFTSVRKRSSLAVSTVIARAAQYLCGAEGSWPVCDPFLILLTWKYTIQNSDTDSVYVCVHMWLTWVPFILFYFYSYRSSIHI